VKSSSLSLFGQQEGLTLNQVGPFVVFKCFYHCGACKLSILGTFNISPQRHRDTAENLN
jgi:hypothetical protein